MARQHRLFMAAAGGSLLFTYGIYLADLFLFGDAHMVWLVSMTLTGAVLLYRSTASSAEPSGRLLPALLLLLLSAGTVYGIWLALLSGYPSAVVWAGGLVIALTAAAVCSAAVAGRQEDRLLHLANILFGYTLAGLVIRLLYAYYLFSEDGRGAVWLLGIPLALFTTVYYAQTVLTGKRRRRIRSGLGVVQLLLLAVLYLLWGSILSGEGTL